MLCCYSNHNEKHFREFREEFDMARDLFHCTAVSRVHWLLILWLPSWNYCHQGKSGIRQGAKTKHCFSLSPSLSLFWSICLSIYAYLCVLVCTRYSWRYSPPVLFYLVSNKHKAGLQGHNVFQQLLKWVQLGRPCYHLKDNWRLIGWLRLIWGRPSLCFRLLPSLCAQSKLSLVAVLSMTGSK